MEKSGVAPALQPMNVAGERGDERWRHFDNSVSAVSFGFVATAILISMFLVMAIFERFLRPRSHLLSRDEDGARGPRGFRRGRSSDADFEAQQSGSFSGKLDYPSPKMSVYSKGVSVLMPGHDIPTFIAHPAPAPCAPERNPWPSHEPWTSHEPTRVCGAELTS